MSNSKKTRVTCHITRYGKTVDRIPEDRVVLVNEQGQRYVVVDGLRYRLDEFNEYEFRYGDHLFSE